jgi:purine-binding chemotaxis protein CheW
MSASTVDEMRYCTFHLADLYLGVPVTEVQEVIRAQETTRVPLVSDVVHGLMNLRGEIVTTLDLRRRLDLPAIDDGTEPMNVVIRTDDGVLSLLVDRIGDVLELDADGFEAPPPTLRGVSRDLVSAVHKLDGHLLLVLDLGRLLALTAA